MAAFKSFAILPAAGRSRRMAEPKLLLDFGGRPLIDLVLQAWIDSHVDRVVVVVRSDDEPLAAYCRRPQVDLVIPETEPADMRASIEFGLDHVARHYQPSVNDAWLVAPADLPGLSFEVVNALLASYRPDSPGVLVPTVDGTRGHPALLPWSCAAQLSRLPFDVGLNSLLRDTTIQTMVREVVWHDRGVLEDMDTPQDYLRRRRQE